MLRADNLTLLHVPMVYKLGDPNPLQTQGPFQHCVGIDLA